jgi:RNA polymerase primary sigma factor
MAVDRFDVIRASRFLTYAAWWIQKEMLDEMSGSSSPVHVPTYLQKQLRKDNREGKFKCVHCGIRTHNIEGYGIRQVCTEEEHEFHLPISDASAMLSSPLPLDTLDLESNDDVFQGVVEEDNGKYLRKALVSLRLRPRDLFILLGFFNVPEGDRQSAPKKLPQLASITRITTERVRQVKERALQKLKVELERQDTPSVGDAH